MTDIESSRPQRRKITTGGERKRIDIIEGVLRIISREGIRAVRHRAVATEAGVSLAATTYYFSSLHDLLVESFSYWCVKTEAEIEEFRAKAQAFLESSGFQNLQSEASRQGLVNAICQLTTDYVIEQVESGRENRNIELAFRHEALRDKRLRERVQAQDHSMLENISAFHRILGTADPEADAEISLAVLLHLERQALMNGVEREKIERVLCSHFHYLAGT